LGGFFFVGLAGASPRRDRRLDPSPFPNEWIDAGAAARNNASVGAAFRCAFERVRGSAESTGVEPHLKRRRTDPREPISFGRFYAQSDTFRTLFKDGMSLVEETADYLDGPGRAAASALPRPASLVYATESMRLTTRLMQLASWLLLHRSVREGDMTAEHARQEKRKIHLESLSPYRDGPGWDELPEPFLALIARSVRLQKRVERIDAALLEGGRPSADHNPVSVQLRELAAALSARE
jgi:regulator of CtrA degradation